MWRPFSIDLCFQEQLGEIGPNLHMLFIGRPTIENLLKSYSEPLAGMNPKFVIIVLPLSSSKLVLL